MDKIRCEICGGEICRQDGKFRCTCCGCLYSADDLRAMLQDGRTKPANTDGMPHSDEHTTTSMAEGTDINKAEKLSESVHPQTARKGRIWVILAVVIVILLVSLAQVWLNVASGTTDSTESNVRSVQEIIDSAAETEQPAATTFSGS